VSHTCVCADEMKHLKNRFEEQKKMVAHMEKLMVRGLTELRDEVAELSKLK
jgi:hypothetical protein